MKPENHYHSYLVRLWREELEKTHQDGVGISRWRGELIHIQTGKSWQFEGLEPLFSLLEIVTNRDAV